MKHTTNPTPEAVQAAMEEARDLFYVPHHPTGAIERIATRLAELREENAELEKILQAEEADGLLLMQDRDRLREENERLRAEVEKLVSMHPWTQENRDLRAEIARKDEALEAWQKRCDAYKDLLEAEGATCRIPEDIEHDYPIPAVAPPSASEEENNG